MNKPESIKRIDPRRVAEKLEAAFDFLLPEIESQIVANPRLTEAVWFLTWVSQPGNYAGGLARFTADFIEDCKARIGPVVLLEKGRRELSPGEVEEVLENFPAKIAESFFPNGSAKGGIVSVSDDEHWTQEAADTARSRRWLLQRGENKPVSQTKSEDCVTMQTDRGKALRRLTFDKLQSMCVFTAESQLAGYFHAVCSEPETGFFGRKIYSSVFADGPRSRHNNLWFFPNLWECLFDWLDARSEKIRSSIAETAITREVFRWLCLAEESRKGVMIIGNSRHGKTEALRAYAGMFPWRVRVIETPHSSAESDLLREIARALGIAFDSLTTARLLRASIDSVLRQSRTMLIFDEAQFLFPSSGGRADPPRLNYVRRSIMDIGIPVVFVCTPQSWKRVEKNYLKVSGYSIEQLEGRLLRSTPVFLPDELSLEELVEVARVHFPDLSDDYLKFIAKIVGGFTGSLLSCFENISCLARYYAKEAGRSKLSIADIEKAISDVLPGSMGSKPQPSPQVPNVEPKTAHERPVNRGLTPPKITTPTRSIKPGLAVAAMAGD